MYTVNAMAGRQEVSPFAKKPFCTRYPVATDSTLRAMANGAAFVRRVVGQALEDGSVSNTLHLRQELFQLALQTDDDQLLSQACLTLRGESETIISSDAQNKD